MKSPYVHISRLMSSWVRSAQGSQVPPRTCVMDSGDVQMYNSVLTKAHTKLGQIGKSLSYHGPTATYGVCATEAVN